MLAPPKVLALFSALIAVDFFGSLFWINSDLLFRDEQTLFLNLLIFLTMC